MGFKEETTGRRESNTRSWTLPPFALRITLIPDRRGLTAGIQASLLVLGSLHGRLSSCLRCVQGIGWCNLKQRSDVSGPHKGGWGLGGAGGQSLPATKQITWNGWETGGRVCGGAAGSWDGTVGSCGWGTVCLGCSGLEAVPPPTAKRKRKKGRVGVLDSNRSVGRSLSLSHLYWLQQHNQKCMHFKKRKRNLFQETLNSMI